jgi:hypothetical protein
LQASSQLTLHSPRAEQENSLGFVELIAKFRIQVAPKRYKDTARFLKRLGKSGNQEPNKGPAREPITKTAMNRAEVSLGLFEGSSLHHQANLGVNRPLSARVLIFARADPQVV